MMRTSDKKNIPNCKPVILILWMLCSVVPLFSGTHFPKPPELQHNVDFWVHIYSLYSQSDVVIHDAEHLNIVYQVINLNDYSSPGASPRERWQVVTNLIREYKEILGSFARTDHVDFNQLNDKERHVYLLWVESNEPNKFIKAQINIRGQRGLMDNFRLGLERSGKYLPEFKRIFKSYQLPEELCYLPHVESSFTNFAFSKSGAAGLWQFIRSTGRIYLKINNIVDERLDPYIASEAAAKLLRHNYQELQSWPLAITAYNHGLNGMVRARKQFGANNFGAIVRNYKSPSFGFASRNFYAEFMAATWVAEHCHFYFDSLTVEQPEMLTHFVVPENININQLAKKLSLPEELLRQYNPALRAQVIHAQRDIPGGFKIRIPHIEDYDPHLAYWGGEQLLSNIAQAQGSADQQFSAAVSVDTIFYLMPEKEIAITNDAESYWTFNNNTVESRKTLKDILYYFSESAFSGIQDHPVLVQPEYKLPLLALLDNVPAIPVAQQMILPTFEINSGFAHTNMTNESTDTVILEQPGLQPEPELYANIVDTSVTPVDSAPVLAALPVENNTLLISTGELYGPELPQDFRYIQTAVNGSHYDLAQVFNFDIIESHWIKVMPEETIGHYADWLRVSSQYLRKLNRFNYRQEIKVGQQVKLAFVQVSEDEFYHKRVDYHKQIRNQLFNAYNITGTTVYEIQPGDNIWKICNQKFNIPYWLIAYYNQNVKWNLLKPGDAINVPIINPYATSADNHYDG